MIGVNTKTGKNVHFSEHKNYGEDWFRRLKSIEKNELQKIFYWDIWVAKKIYWDNWESKSGIFNFLYNRKFFIY